MARTHVIKVPDVGEGIAEVELVAWHVQPNDMVAEDQALADVMTDKASVEIPSPVAGRVVALGGAVGQLLAVGAELVRISIDGEDDAAGERHDSTAASVPRSSSGAPTAKPSEPAVRANQPNTRAPVTGAATAGAPTPAPGVTSGLPSGQHPRPPTLPPPVTRAERPIAAPAVRRRAWELGVNLQDVTATGTAGRIMQADLDAFIATRGAPAPDPAGPGAARAGGIERLDEEAVPVIGLRRRIALQMQEAKRRIPHFSYVEELDVTELESLRATLNVGWGATRGRLTLLPLLMRAMVLALRDFPQINARFDDDKGIVTRYGAVHLGVATQTPNGLMVPVVRHAEARDPWSLAAEVARLAEVARSGRATRAELGGSTITISSLGALGGIVSTPVINRPEVAIVGVNRMVERPVLRGGAVVARQMMNLSSSFDHRVVDGMDAAQFVQALRRLLESPALLFVE